MLAVPVAELPAEAGWSFEPKWDGYRGIATVGDGRVSVASRRGHDMAAWFAELHGLAGALDPHQAVLDGELVAVDAAGRPDFTALQQRTRARGRPSRQAARTVPVVFMVFDLLWLDGQLLTDRPWAQRRAKLEALELAGPAWQMTPSFVDQGERVVAATRDQGLEGVVAKRLDSPYRPGRRHPDWQKLAHERQAVFLVGAYVPSPAGWSGCASPPTSSTTPWRPGRRSSWSRRSAGSKAPSSCTCTAAPCAPPSSGGGWGSRRRTPARARRRPWRGTGRRPRRRWSWRSRWESRARPSGWGSTRPPCTWRGGAGGLAVRPTRRRPGDGAAEAGRQSPRRPRAASVDAGPLHLAAGAADPDG
jgi:ATP dependent DNA ligase domain